MPSISQGTDSAADKLQPQDTIGWRGLTRRRWLSLGVRSAGMVGLCSLGLDVLRGMFRATPLYATPSYTIGQASLGKAYQFLDRMMDLYARGSTLRLAQSDVPTSVLNLGDIGYTYDNAVTLVALLQRGQSNDIERATVLGNSLVYAQAHDPDADGRVRDGYHTDPFVLPNGSVNISDGGTDTGNMAWCGLALAHLYQQTSAQPYLNSALEIGNWVQRHTYDTRGAGGYTGGLTQGQVKLTYKSTENNIDLYAFFTMLETFTGNPIWTGRAQYALTFVQSTWNALDGFFWTGTDDDGVTINQTFIPEDCQSWSYLALGDPTYASSIDWAYLNLAATDGEFSGVSFSNADLSGVWFEGTAHMAAALEARNAPGDAAKAAAYLGDIRLGQAQAPNADGYGIDAASKDYLQTGDGCDYFAALHIGATSWYCVAQQAGNPFLL